MIFFRPARKPPLTVLLGDMLWRIDPSEDDAARPAPARDEAKDDASERGHELMAG